MLKWIQHTALGALVLGAALTSSRTSDASDVPFGPNDAPTVFFISRSNDTSRVDYGMRLDASCAPVNNDALFGYWKEFEGGRPVRTHGMSLIDHIPYGISDQHLVRRLPNGAEYFVRLRQFSRPIGITTNKEADGRCSAVARSMINGSPATLVSVHVTLISFASVDYIDIFGKNAATGAAITERVKK